jgi:hypothetical protein
LRASGDDVDELAREAELLAHHDARIHREEFHQPLEGVDQFSAIETDERIGAENLLGRLVRVLMIELGLGTVLRSESVAPGQVHLRRNMLRAGRFDP